MKSTLIAALAGILAGCLSSTAHAADLPDPLGLGEPGFFGRIDIRGLPRPPKLVFPEPIIIQRVALPPAPVYLRVRPGHEKNWRKNCRKYNACGRPVYFVQDSWYHDDYAPEYRRKHGKRHGDDDHGANHGGNDRDDDDRGGKHGKKGHGNGKGKD